MEKKRFMSFESCNPNNIRAVADRLSKKYTDLDRRHVFWVAKAVGIYPAAEAYKTKNFVDMTKMGKINEGCDLVEKRRLSEKGVSAIESFLVAEGFAVKKEESSL